MTENAAASSSLTSCVNSLTDLQIGASSTKPARSYVDITDLLFKKCQNLKNDVVVKSPSFSLFEGTHALEMMNPRLDSGIIQLTDDEVNFNCCKPLSLNQVLGISDRILRSVFAWMNNNSLSVTVLSCRYIEQLLVNYTGNVQAGIIDTHFYREHEPVEVNTAELKLVHQVLRSVCLATLHLVRICLSLGQSGVVYEEEDINTQTMNLDIISLVKSEDILSELDASLAFLHGFDEPDAELLAKIIEILRDFMFLPKYQSMEIPVSNGVKVPTPEFDSILSKSELLNFKVDYLNEIQVPNGCLSLGIQKRLENRSPVKDLIDVTKEEDYTSLIKLAQSFIASFEISKRGDNTLQINNFMIIFSQLNNHVLLRAFMSLFLIRDDRKIVGVEDFTQFLISDLKSLTCLDCDILSNDNLVIANKFNEITEVISVTYFEWFNSLTQNPCRQRQHLSRLIVLFDTLQAQIEPIEYEIFQVFKTADFVEINGSSIPSLPVSTWIYFKKLDIMINFILMGFKLEIYKKWEFCSMYWYVQYLVENMLLVLNRVQQCNEFKIENINNMSKKLKNKKGDQKQRYKEKYQFKLNNVVPELVKINSSIGKMQNYYKMYRDLAHINLIKINKANSTNDNTFKQPDFPFIKNPTILYDLRMKSFSTVGVPEYQKYNEYKASLNNLLKTVDLTNAEKSLETNLNSTIQDISGADSSHPWYLLKDQHVALLKELVEFHRL